MLYPGPVLSPDGLKLATYNTQGFGIWSLKGAPEFQAVPLEGEKLEELWFSPNSERLLVLTWSRKAILYSLDPPAMIAEWQEEPAPPNLPARDFKTFEISFNGNRILNFEPGASACVRDAKTGEILEGVIDICANWVEHAAFTSDGRRMAFRFNPEAGWSVWDVEDMCRLVQLPPFTSHPDREKLCRLLGLEPEPPPVQVSGKNWQTSYPFRTNLNRSYEFDTMPARFAPDGERLVCVVPQEGIVVWERRRPE